MRALDKEEEVKNDGLPVPKKPKIAKKKPIEDPLSLEAR